MSPLHVLLIERDGDRARVLEGVLARAGHGVLRAHDAQSGLEQLHVFGVDVIVLGEGSGTSGAEGRALRLLHRIPTVRLGSLDPEHLPAAIAALLQMSRAPTRDAARPGADPDRLELVLYITSESIASMRALRNVRLALEALAHQPHLTVVNLAAGNGSAGDEDRVRFTPTLVRRGPGQRFWAVGSLEDPEALRALLRD